MGFYKELLPALGGYLTLAGEVSEPQKASGEWGEEKRGPKAIREWGERHKSS
jgi:hypothetical protein